jgi:alpha-galactosidase
MESEQCNGLSPFPALLLCYLLLFSGRALALDDGLARTPPMGWNSWNPFQLNINEAVIRSAADAIATNGMKAAGYHYLVVDAGWKGKGRDATGRLTAEPSKFPSGMKALADYVHARGLKFGVYTDAGAQDCVAGTPGSKGSEALDAATFAEWGVDFLKEDWCHTEGMDAKSAYGVMHEAIAATGRSMVFSVCEWGDNRPWNWGGAMAHMWRTTGDIKDCWDCGQETTHKLGGYPRGWTLILDAQPDLQAYAGPGHWNDPDMLVVGLPGLTVEEARAHFSLWCILAAPLICGCDVTTLSPEIAGILLNPEVIAVDQDALGIQGSRVLKHGEVEVWSKPLSEGSRAVVFFNRGKSPARITASSEQLGLPPPASFTARDLWGRKALGHFTGSFSATVAPHAVAMIKTTPVGRRK